MTKDHDTAYIKANIQNPADAARLIARVLALKRLLAATEKKS